MSSACSFDLGRLRGPGDVVSIDGGSQDATNDVGSDALDAPVAMDAFDAGPTDGGTDVVDVPPVDTGVDTGPSNACTTRPDVDALVAGVRIGPSVIVSNSTIGAMSLVDPPTLAPGCPSDYTTGPAPEQAYRYTMTDGTWLQVTTDAPTCATTFDTIVYVRSACDRTSGTALACDDDDFVLPCTTGPGGRMSTAVANTLAPGTSVYVFVDGYGGNAGQFRLAITENGLAPASPPLTGAADRCTCPTGTTTMPISTAFPSDMDVLSSHVAGVLSVAGDAIGGSHTLGGAANIGAAGLQFRLVSNALGTGTGCSAAVATLDLLINGMVVASFTVDPSTPTGVPLRVALGEFADVAVRAALPTPIALRLRAVTVLGCGGIGVQTSPAGTLTVLGGP